MAIDASTQLSSNYSLGDLCITNHALSQPNLPPDQSYVNNLAVLADVLEELAYKIGPFRIVSGFRTKELQNALGESGLPVAIGTSYHELGRAVDIVPTSASTDDYFGLILADQSLTNKFVEIANKPGQNSLHLAINVPGDTRPTKIMGLDAVTNKYQKLDESSITNFILSAQEKFTQVVDDMVQQVDPGASSAVVSAVNWTLVLAGAGLLAILLMSGKKSNERV